QLAPVEPRVHLGLLFALARAIEEFAALLEKRRLSYIAVEVGGELVVQPGNRRCVSVEPGECDFMLAFGPRLHFRALPVLEPAVAIGELDAVDDVDNGPRRRRRRIERWCGDGKRARHDQQQSGVFTGAATPRMHVRAFSVSAVSLELRAGL